MVFQYWCIETFYLWGGNKRSGEKNLPWQHVFLKGPFKGNIARVRNTSARLFPSSPSFPPFYSQYQNNKFLCAPSYETISHHLHALGWGSPHNQRLYPFAISTCCFSAAKCYQLAIQHSVWGKKIVIVFRNTDCIKWQLDWKTAITLG